MALKPSLFTALLILVCVHWASTVGLRAENSAPEKTAEKPPVNVCIVSGEHLQPGDIVTYVYQEDGKPDRTVRFCCRKCLARFKADPARYLKKLDQLEAGGKDVEKPKTD
jgi:hypothetical protein